MGDYKIAVLPGDGIGIDVTAEAVKVLKAVASLDGGINFEFQEFPWGSQYYLAHGEMMPKDAIDTLAGFNSILLGAVGDPAVPDHVTLWGMLLPIRQCFQEYVNLRPSKLLPGIESPLRGKGVKDIDIVFVRENMEGEYAGVGGECTKVHLLKLLCKLASLPDMVQNELFDMLSKLLRSVQRSILPQLPSLTLAVTVWFFGMRCLKRSEKITLMFALTSTS